MLNKTLIMATLMLLMPLTIHAKTLDRAISVEYMSGERNVEGGRIAYRPHKTMVETPEWLGLGTIDLEFEMSLSFWEFKGPEVEDLNHAIAFTPIFSQVFYRIEDKYPVKWEFGIGVTMIEVTRFATKDIGSRFQFEDRMGILVAFGEQRRESLALRYMHYSNGSLNDENPGLDFMNLGYAYRF